MAPSFGTGLSFAQGTSSHFGAIVGLAHTLTDEMSSDGRRGDAGRAYSVVRVVECYRPVLTSDVLLLFG
jgi:hypothetical protein